MDKPVPSLALLSLASSLSPFGMIVVVPALGAMSQRYNLTPGEVQFLIATYLLGLGMGQPMAGFLSDRYGRRPIILAGFAFFTLASLFCVLVDSFAGLLFFRFMQALGVSVGTVGSRAIVRDTRDAEGVLQSLAWIGAAMGFAPVLGPLVGGLLSSWFGPQSVFAPSALLGLFVTLAMYARLAETRTESSGESQNIFTSYRQLLGSRVFVGYTLMYAFMQGIFFAFLAVGALVFAEHLQINEETFGAIWGLMGLIYVAGAAMGARITRRHGPEKVMVFNTGLIFFSGLLLLASVALGGVTLLDLLPALSLLMLATGIQTPISVAQALNCRPDIAGTAAGLSSAMALVVSGSFSIFSGYLYAGNFLPVAVLIATSAGLVVVTYRMTQ